MKKTMQAFLCSLFGLTVLFPVGTVLCSLAGYRFLLISSSGFAIFLGLLSVCAVVFSVVLPTEVGKAVGVIAAFMPIVTLINSLFLIFSRINIFGVLGLLVSFACACYMVFKYAKTLTLKIVAMVIAAALAVPVGFFGFIAMIFGNIGKDTVVQSVESPNGTYTAQLIDSDQGALGGDTLVLVYEKGGIDLLLLRIEKKPQRVYLGQWGAFNHMKLNWKNDHCLLINDTEYEIE